MSDHPELNAYLDGELGDAERRDLEARLAQDGTLRAALERLRKTDAELRGAYGTAGNDVEALVARVHIPHRGRILPWLTWAGGVAAGIAIGIALSRPASSPPVKKILETTVPAGMATLSTKGLYIDRGQEFVRTQGPGTLLSLGDRVRSPLDGRAVLTLRDGSEVRLDRDTTIHLHDARNVEVLRGRIWSRVHPGVPFLVAAGPTTVRVFGTQVAVHHNVGQTRVDLFSGAATVEAGGEIRKLKPGQWTEFKKGRLSRTQRIRSIALATSWMLELSAFAGDREPELARHMDRLLAEMGFMKISHLQEKTIIEDLGGICRVPLSRYLVSENAKRQDDTRLRSARVLEAIADESVADALLQGLRDPLPMVRVHCARALRRISERAICSVPNLFQKLDGRAQQEITRALDWYERKVKKAGPGSPGERPK